MDSNTTGIPPNATVAASAGSVPASTGSVRVVAATGTTGEKQDGATAVTKQDNLLQRDPRSLQFQVDGDRVITTIVDKNDNTVVVQIPDADMIRIAKAIDRMQGFLVEDKA